MLLKTVIKCSTRKIKIHSISRIEFYIILLKRFHFNFTQNILKKYFPMKGSRILCVNNILVLEMHVICIVSFSFLCEANKFIRIRWIETHRQIHIMMFWIQEKSDCDELFYVQSHLVDDDVSNPCFRFVVCCCCSRVILRTIWLRIRKWSSFSMCICIIWCFMDGKFCVISATSTLPYGAY